MGRFDTEGFEPPKSWEKLVSLREFLMTYGGATRLQEDQEYYDLYSATMPRDAILTFIKKQLKGKEVGIVKNHFPYTLILQYLPSIGHYLVWSLRGPLSEKEISQIVEDKFPQLNWMWFETHPVNKSVPEIWHAHVFINKDENNSQDQS